MRWDVVTEFGESFVTFSGWYWPIYYYVEWLRNVGLILKWHKVATSCFGHQLIILTKVNKVKNKTRILQSINLGMKIVCEIRKKNWTLV